MTIEVKKKIGIIFLILIYGFIFILIAGGIGVACSIKSNNLFGVAYEPSGLQMLYYTFTYPIFMILAIINFYLNKWLGIKKWYAINITIIWFMFWVFNEYVNDIVHFPAGNELFYYGSFIIGVFSFILMFFFAYWQIMLVLKMNK